MTPFQLAIVHKIRDFKVDFQKFFRPPHFLIWRGYGTPLQTSPASAFRCLPRDLRALHLPQLEKADLSMPCLILWFGSTSFTNNEYVCAIPFLKLQLEVFHTVSLRAWMSKVGHSFMKLFRCVEFLVKTQGNHIDWWKHRLLLNWQDDQCDHAGLLQAA